VCWQIVATDAKKRVVDEIKTIKGQLESEDIRILLLRNAGQPSLSLVHLLSDQSLRDLGAADTETARNSKSHSLWVGAFIANLKSCLVDTDGAFPDCKIQSNTTGSKLSTDKAFKGDYLTW